MARIVWFSVRFLLLYALLQTAFSFWPLNVTASRLVGSLAAQTLRVCLDRPVLWSAVGNEIKITVPIRVAGSWKAAVADLREGWYTRNIPMFLAIVLAAATWTRRLRLVAVLGFGVLAIVVLDGFVAAAHAWATMPTVAPFTAAYHVLSVFGMWSLGGMFAAPMFVGALLAFTLLGEGPEGLRVDSAGRNDPCPCGSGLKYKRCCGAAPASG